MSFSIRGVLISQKTINTFWSKVEVLSEEDCWNWQAGSHSKRKGFEYGSFWIPGLRSVQAHRFALAVSCGSWIDSMDALHSCDNARCCNPRHLKYGTHLENMQDMNSKGRRKNLERGENRPSSKLNPFKVRLIRKRYSYHLRLLKEAKRLQDKASQHNLTSLTKYFGVGGNVIRSIIKRTGWKHVK